MSRGVTVRAEQQEACSPIAWQRAPHDMQNRSATIGAFQLRITVELTYAAGQSHRFFDLAVSF
jgi:hypothetical protein